MAFAGRREWRCRQWSQGSEVETVHMWMKSFAKDNCPSQHQEYFSVSLSPLLVFSSPAKTAVPFSCPLPATCQGAASVFGTLQPGRAEQPQGLHWGQVCAVTQVFRQWRCGSGAVWEKELVSCKPSWTQEGKESPEMLGGTTLDSFFAVSPNRSALNYLK